MQFSIVILKNILTLHPKIYHYCMITPKPIKQ